MKVTPIAAADFARPIQAFLVALSFGESENDPLDYTELCGGGHFEGFAAFPQWAGVGDPISHAAGRYQFEPATWRDMQGRLSLPDFSPTSQDHAAWALASEVYQRVTGRVLLADLQADDLASIAPALRSTWTSVNGEFPARYHGALAALTPAQGDPDHSADELNRQELAQLSAPAAQPVADPAPAPPAVSPGTSVAIGSGAAAVLTKNLMFLSACIAAGHLLPLDETTAGAMAAGSLMLGGWYAHRKSRA